MLGKQWCVEAEATANKTLMRTNSRKSAFTTAQEIMMQTLTMRNTTLETSRGESKKERKGSRSPQHRAALRRVQHVARTKHSLNESVPEESADSLVAVNNSTTQTFYNKEYRGP